MRGAAHDLGGAERAPECHVPSDSDLGLLAGFSAACARTFVHVARAHHLVAAARAELGPANPGVINAPGEGVTEEADLVRAKYRGVLRAPDMDSSEVEDRGYQQGFASPTAVYRRRAALGQLAQAAFLTPWR